MKERKLTKETGHMDDKTRDQIIDDLLLKRPKGPAGVKLTYIVDHAYDYGRRAYVDHHIADHPTWGYDPMVFFNLGFYESINVDHYIRRRWFDGKNKWELRRQNATVTRRMNRIWNRIKDTVRQIRTAGDQGIYRVSTRYGGSSDFGHIFAKSPDEVKIMFQTFFPNITNTSTIKVEFVESGTVEKLNEYNNHTRVDLKSKISRLRRDIEANQKRIKEHENHISTLTVLEGHQLAIETT